MSSKSSPSRQLILDVESRSLAQMFRSSTATTSLFCQSSSCISFFSPLLRPARSQAYEDLPAKKNYSHNLSEWRSCTTHRASLYYQGFERSLRLDFTSFGLFCRVASSSQQAAARMHHQQQLFDPKALISRESAVCSSGNTNVLTLPRSPRAVRHQVVSKSHGEGDQNWNHVQQLIDGYACNQPLLV